jgi:hypothetical protein
MHTSSGMEETTKKEEKLQGGVCPIEYQKKCQGENLGIKLCRIAPASAHER